MMMWDLESILLLKHVFSIILKANPHCKLLATDFHPKSSHGMFVPVTHAIFLISNSEQVKYGTGFSNEIGTKLRDWAVGQALGSCYCWAALSSNDSKTL